MTVSTPLVFALGAWLAAATAARAQTATPDPDDAAPGTSFTSFTAGMLRDLPASNNLFSLLETTAADVTTDRFYGGGLNIGRPARVGAFLNSWTQTQYRVGDVNITVPDGSGAPFLFPTLPLWERITVATGFMPAGFNAPGLGVSFEPRRPGTTWTHVVDASASGSGLVAGPAPGAPAPPIERLSGWMHGGLLASGPLVANRLGVVAAVEWTGSSQVERTGASEPDGQAASAFANLVFTPTAADEIRTVGWIQRTQAPFAGAAAFQQPLAAEQQVFAHVQTTWARRESDAMAFRLFAAYSQRTTTRDIGGGPVAPLVERLSDGPVPSLVDTGDRSDRRWSLGVRATTPPRAQRGQSNIAHTFQVGLDLGGGGSRVAPGFSGSIGELVDGSRARMWTYSNAGIDARRHETTIAAFVADRVDLGARVTLEAGLAYDGVSGSADGAATSVAWDTVLARASIRWAATEVAHVALFAGYRRSADSLPLDTLAVGDPAAETATVSPWTSQGVGPLVARVGPGTHGDAAFSAIDASLNRPITDELTVGVESRPIPSVRLRLAGVVKRERNLLDLVDTGAPLSSYSVSTVTDGRPGGDVILPVYNRLPSSFGSDRYLLTNAAQDPATFSGAVFSAEATTDRFVFLFGATASQTGGLAASRGFHADENDVAVAGELFIDPNAATNARGRLFIDRAYTIKLAATYRFPSDVNLGVIARYQDGQPFSRMTVVPGLNQGTEVIRAFPAGDSRFTYTGTLDLRLQKGFAAGSTRIDAIVDAYNLVNLGNEVEERIVTGPGFRDITAIQPPRAFHLGLRLTF